MSLRERESVSEAAYERECEQRGKRVSVGEKKRRRREEEKRG